MMRWLALASIAAACSTMACGQAPNATSCNQTSDCTGDAVCTQNICQQGFRLTASTAGDGNGRVTSAPDGISCPGTCSAAFPAGTTITLRSIPDASSDFMGWSGSCSGTGSCAVTMDAGKSAIAKHKLVRMVFESNRNVDGSDTLNANGTLNIWRFTADGKGLVPLTTAIGSGAGSFNPQWSPDGTQIVFASSRAITGADAANTNGTSNIWRVNADGTGLTALTTAVGVGAGSFNPRWSPDGASIVFASSRNVDGTDTGNPNGTNNIWRIAASGSPTTLVPLTRNVGSGAGSVEPVWSPDGSRIAFTSTRAFNADAANVNGTQNVWRVNATPPATPVALTTLTASGAGTNTPQWSPDGTRIVFYSGRALNGTDNANANSTQNVWLMNADGTGFKPLTNTTAANAGNFIPLWSPDGTRIILASTRKLDGTDAANTNSDFNVWSVAPDGTGLTPLTTSVGTGVINLFAVWSPAAARLFFLSSRNPNGTDTAGPNGAINIWSVGADGTNLVPLTTNNAGVSNLFPIVAP